MKLNKTKIYNFLWDTFSDEYQPWRKLDTEGLNPKKGLTICIPCCSNHSNLVTKAILSVQDLSFVKSVLVNLQNCEVPLEDKELWNSKVTCLYTGNKNPSQSRNMLRLRAETDYIFYLDADDTVDGNGLEDMYNALLRNPDCLIAPNNTVSDTDADNLFSLQSSMIAPRTLIWNESLEVLEDCATYCGYPITIVSQDSSAEILHRTYLPNGQRNKNGSISIFRYLIWLEPKLPFDFLNYIYHSTSKYKKYFLIWFSKYLLGELESKN